MFNYDIKGEIEYIHAHPEIEKLTDITKEAGWEERLLKPENWRDVWSLQRINNMHYAMQGSADRFLSQVAKLEEGRYNALLIGRDGKEYRAEVAPGERWALLVTRRDKGNALLPAYIGSSEELITMLTSNGLKVKAFEEAAAAE